PGDELDCLGLRAGQPNHHSPAGSRHFHHRPGLSPVGENPLRRHRRGAHLVTGDWPGHLVGEERQMTAAQKNLAMLGVLVVVAAALGLYAYFGVRKPEEREAKRKETAEKLFSAEAPAPKDKKDAGPPAEAAFTAINVRAKGEVTTLEKRGDRWWVTSPVYAPAEKWAVDQIISQIKSTRFKSTVEENPSDADLAKYGFSNPTFTVNGYYSLPGKTEIQPDAGSPYQGRERITFYGGIDNPFDGSVYLRREGDKAVYLV